MARRINRGAIPDELGWLADVLDDYEERLRTLEAPSGEALASNVAKLEALIDDIQDQLDAWVATRWTNAQIQTEIDNKITAKFAGDVTFGGKVWIPNVPATTFVAEPRAVVWVDTSNGRLGRT